jgi:hypothetical protein
VSGLQGPTSMASLAASTAICFAFFSHSSVSACLCAAHCSRSACLCASHSSRSACLCAAHCSRSACLCSCHSAFASCAPGPTAQPAPPRPTHPDSPPVLDEPPVITTSPTTRPSTSLISFHPLTQRHKPPLLEKQQTGHHHAPLSCNPARHLIYMSHPENTRFLARNQLLRPIADGRGDPQSPGDQCTAGISKAQRRTRPQTINQPRP